MPDSKHTPEELLEIAIKASLEAGEAIIDIYNSNDLNIDVKSDNSPLTKADIASNRVIMKFLTATGIPVLSEEGRAIPFEERKKWEQLWIVDPMDGTKEFIKRNGEFTVNIALIENGKVKMGIVFSPVLKDLYFGLEGLGSYKVSGVSRFSDDLLLKGSRLPLRKDRSVYTVVSSRSHMSTETENFINELKVKHGEVKLTSIGSSLKLCMVAEGSADCYPRFAPTMEWDTAAGQGVCEYAGCQVVDWTTKKTMKYNREDLVNNWFVVV
jgi:3'(2'), 5'-bisphosphate nucleotidase